jgi:hypothetical protein
LHVAEYCEEIDSDGVDPFADAVDAAAPTMSIAIETATSSRRTRC